MKGSPVIYDRGSGVFYAENEEGTEYTQVGRSEVRTIIYMLKGTVWGNRTPHDMPSGADLEMVTIMRERAVDGVVHHRDGYVVGDIICEEGQRYLVTGQKWPKEFDNE